jgi:hypothetical protein
MISFDVNLAAPSHAVEPALLAQRLPCLATALNTFASAPVKRTQTPATSGTVNVYGATLGVQRDHVTLETLPLITAPNRQALTELGARLAADFTGEGWVFNALEHGQTLGTLNLNLALPAAANFIGRDISHALPRTADARALRQFVNAAQMALHQSPIQDCAVNSLWCSQAIPNDPLLHTWLQGGLTAWWDALPAWDTALALDSFSQATQLNLIYSDVTLSVALKRRSRWALWTKPLALSDMLNS